MDPELPFFSLRNGGPVPLDRHRASVFNDVWRKPATSVGVRQRSASSGDILSLGSVIGAFLCKEKSGENRREIDNARRPDDGHLAPRNVQERRSPWSQSTDWRLTTGQDDLADPGLKRGFLPSIQGRERAEKRGAEKENAWPLQEWRTCCWSSKR